MDFQIERKALREALQGCVADKRSTLPATQSVLVQAMSDGEVMFSSRSFANSTDVGMVRRVKADVLTPGTALIPAPALKDAAKGAGIVSFGSTSDRRIIIGSTQLFTGKVDDFPPVPLVGDVTVTATLDVAALADLARYCGEPSTRPAISGVSLRARDGDVVACAADGYRLMQRTVGKAGAPMDCILPKAAIAALAKATGSATLKASGDYGIVSLESGDTVCLTHLINASFPNTDKLIPVDWHRDMEVSADGLLAACDQLRPIAKQGSGIVRLYEGEGNTLTMRAKAEEIGEVECEIAVTHHLDRGGAPVKIAFNLEYLRELALTEKGGQVRMKLPASPSSPGRFDGRNVHVVMPMFVQW